MKLYVCMETGNEKKIYMILCFEVMEAKLLYRGLGQDNLLFSVFLSAWRSLLEM